MRFTMNLIRQRNLRIIRLKRWVLMFATFSPLSVTFRTSAQQPHNWSIALVDTLMKRNADAPEESLTGASAISHSFTVLVPLLIAHKPHAGFLD
jgi:hypothetical protein